jgi:hypothetical protein
MNKRKETEYLEILADIYGVTDVYFHKGVLFVVNGYDVPLVEDFLETVSDLVTYQYIEDDACIFVS